MVDLCGRAALNDTALFEHVDFVSINDLTDVVRNDNHRAALLDGIKAGLDLFGGDGIEAGGGFIKEDDGGILDEHAGNGHALLLTAAELQSGCAKRVGQMHHLLVEKRLFAGTNHVVVSGSGVAILDVLFDGTIEDVILLQHQPYVFAQPLRVPVSEVHPIERDASAVGMVEFIEQVDDGALARTAQSHQCGNLAGFDVHRHVHQSLGSVGV